MNVYKLKTLLLLFFFIFTSEIMAKLPPGVQETRTRPRASFQAPDFVVDTIQRDPFYRVLDQPGWELTALTDYDIEELELLVVVWGVPSPSAMFSGPNNKKFIVEVGDRIGRQNGEIFAITEGKVHIRERFVGFDGFQRERTIIKGVR